MSAISPLDLILVNGALTYTERTALAFARQYGLLVEGCTTEALARTTTVKLVQHGRFHTSFSEEAALADNVTVADVVLLLAGEAVPTGLEEIAVVTAALARLPLVVIAPGRDWQDELKAALGLPGLRRLYITGGSPSEVPKFESYDSDGPTWQLLTAVFNYLDPRDPSTTLIPQQLQSDRIRALRSRYPHQFPESLSEYMVDPDAGWLDLVEKLCADIDALLPEEFKSAFQWTQIKEKFGGLRAYWSQGPLYGDIRGSDGVTTIRITTRESENSLWDQVDALIEAAQQQSFWICGACGAPGRLRSRSWHLTLCDLHAKPGWVHR